MFGFLMSRTGFYILSKLQDHEEDLEVNVKLMKKTAQIFVAFSEKLNFTFRFENPIQEH